MRPVASNPKSAGISLSGPKSEKTSLLNARNVAITTFVLGLLGAIATILLWQLGGLTNWVTYTVAGVSGALLIGSAIAAMISYTTKSGQKPPSHSTTIAAISSKTPIAQSAPPKAFEPPKKLPSAKDLKGMNKNPCTWDHDQRSDYIGLAINAGNTDLVGEYLREFSWVLNDPTPSISASACELSQVLHLLTRKTPQPIVELLSKKLHELLKKEIHLIQDPNKTPYLGLRRGPSLVTEAMIREFASFPIICALIDVYPFDLPKDLVIPHQEAVQAHRDWMERVHLERLCKEGGNVDTIIERMTQLQLQPTWTIGGFEPDESNASVFSLLIQSGKVEIIKAFIQRTNLIITPEIMKFVEEKGSSQVVSLFQTIVQEKQARKRVAFDRIAGMFMGFTKHPPAAVAKQFKESGLARNDKALEGPYKGKTILQLVVENGLHDYVAPVMQDVPADRRETPQISDFFLGNATETDLSNLYCITNIQKNELLARREKDRARVDALRECSKLAIDSRNQTEILRLMSTHDLQPDTMFPLMDFRTPLEVAATSHAATELHKTLIAMRGKVVVPGPNQSQHDVKLNT